MPGRPVIVVTVEDREVTCTFLSDTGDVYGATTALFEKDVEDMDLSARIAASILIHAAQQTIDAIADGSYTAENALFERVAAATN